MREAAEGSCLKEIAKRYLKKPHHFPDIWAPADTEVEELFRFIYHGGIWDAHAREKYPTVRAKQPPEWTLDDIYAYLTCIALADRTVDGFFNDRVNDGTVARLLERYLQLEEGL